MIEITNEEEFYDVINNNENAVIDCWAPWCGPCMQQKPLFEELEVPEGVVKATLNVQVNQELAKKLDIRMIPTFLCYINNGQRDGLFNNVEQLKEYYK